VKISALRTLFHSQLSPLYEKREIDALFFIYIDNLYDVKKHHYFLQPDKEIIIETTDIEKLSKGEPLQYVIGKTTFCDFQIEVNPSVLIPRPETEELVGMILEGQKAESRKQKVENEKKSPSNNEKRDPICWRGNSLFKILEIGTGSGAIAVALAKNIANAKVWATDLSAEALAVAKKNAANNHTNITFLQHDMLKNDDSLLPIDVDVVVSNPPYIPLKEKKKMHKNVVEYEPAISLFVPDEEPLVFYVAIAKMAKKILRRGGVLYFETYEKFHFELSAILSKSGFQEIVCREDMNGKPRFMSCKKL
jgi:release factor glutamine methyltransferase